MSFRSRINGWVMVLLVLAPLALFGFALASHSIAAGAVGGGLLALYASCLLPMRYEFTANELSIRSGLLKTSIPYDGIRAVRQTRNPLGAPALSLQRLEISFASNGRVLISPADEAGFLRELAKRPAPGVRLEVSRP